LARGGERPRDGEGGLATCRKGNMEAAILSGDAIYEAGNRLSAGGGVCLTEETILERKACMREGGGSPAKGRPAKASLPSKKEDTPKRRKKKIKKITPPRGNTIYQEKKQVICSEIP